MAAPPWCVSTSPFHCNNVAITWSYFEQVLQLLVEEMDAKVAISAVCFQSEYCRPMKMAEMWLRKHRELAKNTDGNIHPAFLRLESMLTSATGRVKVLGCLHSKTPLEGTSESNVGILECRQLLLSPGSQKCKKRKVHVALVCHSGAQGSQYPLCGGAPKCAH